MSEWQHSIDLMPAALRARSQAGLRMGQLLAFGVITMTITIAVATHSRIALSTAQDRLFETAGAAEQIFATEARASELKHELEAIRGFTRFYDRLAFPLRVGDILATIIDLMPESITLDQIDLDAGARTLVRSTRARGAEKGEPNTPRTLTAEISGFAADDQQIAELVSALEQTPPFQNVSLDFSRGRRVNDRDAREFRLSFRISLDDRYIVNYGDVAASRPDDSGGQSSVKEIADAD